MGHKLFFVNSPVHTNKVSWITQSCLSPQGDPSSLDHSISSTKDDLLLCDDSLLPSRRIIGDRGGPASMKENICQVAYPSALTENRNSALFHSYLSEAFSCSVFLKLCLLLRCVRRRGSCCSARVSAAELSTWPASLWPRLQKGSLSVPSANQVLRSKALKVIGSVISYRHSIVVWVTGQGHNKLRSMHQM